MGKKFLFMKYLTIVGVLPLFLATATPLKADPTIGFGITLHFGAGGVQPGIGVRVFSDNQRDSPVWSIGVDYVPGNGTWRGTLGGGWMGHNGFVGLDMGISLTDGEQSFGVSVGGVNTASPPQTNNPMPVAPPPQQPPPQPLPQQPLQQPPDQQLAPP
jgi:hypothetical protein